MTRPGSSAPLGLFGPGSYTVDSSPALASAVQKAVRANGLSSAVVVPVAELAGARSRTVRPADLLLGLGKTTSALPGLHAAGAAGMPGLLALRTASYWAIIRYLWAFSPARPALRLSDLTRQVRFHNRTILSEHFGIAVAADLVERVVLAGKPAQVVDADAVSYDPYLSVSMRNLGSHKPDYFWYQREGRALTDVVVVEAKGNSSGRGQSIRQLARGVEQVLVPARVSRTRMRRLVIGAETVGRTLRGYAVEVMEPEQSLRSEAITVIAERARRDRGEDAGDFISDVYDVPDDDGPAEDVVTMPRIVNQDPGVSWDNFADFTGEVLTEVAAEDVDTLDRNRLLTFAGMQDQPRHADPNLPRGERPTAVLEVPEGTFACETVDIPLVSGKLTLWTGVSAEVLTRQAQKTSSTEAGYRLVETDGQRAAIGVISPDGCLLALSGPDEFIGELRRTMR